MVCYKEVYWSLISKYGVTPQLVVAIEELSELQKEITKTIRGKCNVDNLLEEVADVEIMLDQIKLLYDNNNSVDEIKENKINRIIERMNNNNL